MHDDPDYQRLRSALEEFFHGNRACPSVTMAVLAEALVSVVVDTVREDWRETIAKAVGRAVTEGIIDQAPPKTPIWGQSAGGVH